jgi:multidrug resistance efflux pump
MAMKIDQASARKYTRHPIILRSSAFVIATVLSLTMITAVIPPIIADESDRAVINAPVTLLTSPIDGEIETLSAQLDHAVEEGNSLARISNAKLDRSTLISLEEKASDAREKLQATQAKGNSDRAYIAAIDAVIAGQTAQLKSQFRSQIVELRAMVAASESAGGAKKALVERQTGLVQRNTASMDMLKPTIQEYGATQHKAEAERAKLIRRSSSSALWIKTSMSATTSFPSVRWCKNGVTSISMPSAWRSRRWNCPPFFRRSSD